jgi:ubiquinone/menaquinone biosynthesis C-methylase UbiE
MDSAKQLVKDFWNQHSCGEQLYMVGEDLKSKFKNQLKERLRLEPFIPDFAEFSNWKDKNVLEIGVGLGADHQMFAEQGAILNGCDLTERAVEYTRQRLDLFNLHSDLKVADAENLPYSNEQFDLVYSYGVIHTSPNTPQAVKEIHRVLKNDGAARIMIYHKYSIVGFMLWIRYALLKGKPGLSLDEIYSRYLESPGTKAYSIKQAKELFKDFNSVEIDTVLSHGDLLSSRAGQRHQGFLLDLARIIHPRWIIKTFFPKNGLFMFVTLKK